MATTASSATKISGSYAPPSVSVSESTTTSPRIVSSHLATKEKLMFEPKKRTLTRAPSNSATNSFYSGTKSAPTTPSFQQVPLTTNIEYFKGYTLSSAPQNSYHYEAQVQGPPDPSQKLGERISISRSLSPSAQEAPRFSRTKSVTSSPVTTAHSTPPKSATHSASSGCQYETALINSRRRIPYSLGAGRLANSYSQKLDKLGLEEEAKLTVAMEKLYSELLPSEESSIGRRKLIKKLETLLNENWPGKNIRVYPFGSSENLLCSNNSDVDVCIVTDWKELEDTCMLSRFWASRKYYFISNGF